MLKWVVARLTILTEAGTQTSHDLTEETMTLGRSPENAIRIDDPSVSGRHAELLLVGGTCYLKDLDSTNGTQVNGESIVAVELRAGDRIQCGNAEASFESDLSEPASSPPEFRERGSQLADVSARPTGFASASPFPDRKREKDRAGRIILAVAAAACLIFLGSMIALYQMRAPRF
jgi:pSer/pThr/pTyr-binding forkhead associated (FHA) protein